MDQSQRRSLRLQGYDYSQAGAYFVTICTRNHAPLFGDIVGGEMHPGESGLIVHGFWDKLPDRFPRVTLDTFVLMPNHVHGIIDVGAIYELPLRTLSRRSMLIPMAVGRFKMNTAKQINQVRGTPGVPVWQRNYYEHVVRNEDEMNRIREYIVNNPLRWALDRENPQRTGDDDFELRPDVFC